MHINSRWYLLSEKRFDRLHLHARTIDLTSHNRRPGYFENSLKASKYRNGLDAQNCVSSPFWRRGRDSNPCAVLPANWFRVSPVMTTSIPLHIRLSGILIENCLPAFRISAHQIPGNARFCLLYKHFWKPSERNEWRTWFDFESGPL